MFGYFLTYFTYLVILAPVQNLSCTQNETYYDLPRFWTNTGFCPAGEIGSENLRATLLSDEVQMNLIYIAALPTNAFTHVRIHWLLKLIKFVQYTPSGVPIYDFTSLDTFLMNLNDIGLYPVIEFMTDLDGILFNNLDSADFLWQDFSYQVAGHYLNLLGPHNLRKWRFETWNEPDIPNYNRLNFTAEGFIKYVLALRRGLKAVGRNQSEALNFSLRGPAGLFKSKRKHPLCWALLQSCDSQINQCPIDVLTFHRKGQGLATEVLKESAILLESIYRKYPNIKTIPIANDEADPIAGWSTPHDYYEDVRYAAQLVYIVFLHWHAKLHSAEFQYLESISHDNAFISYHPHEFSQRTLLAHFRMNKSEPLHSQFIQKPVYAALGMLSKLAPLAADIETISLGNSTDALWLLKTCSTDNNPLYLSWLLLPRENATNLGNFIFHHQLSFVPRPKEIFAYIIEILEQRKTDPAYIWRTQTGATPFPNAQERDAMRRVQASRLQASGILLSSELILNTTDLKLPWIALFRVCSSFSSVLKQPDQVIITRITIGEVFISWREATDTVHCLKTYEIWFQPEQTTEWRYISENWHLPYPSFQYAPPDSSVSGFYKIRGVDLFNGRSKFSTPVEYIETKK
ncbi:alpha-L-iduronidase [Ceratitis capitata]|uniref:(Mediterranean fruit fly) hypothetical protein n=1 Tax=Ceratitis capitata TaxID=7213 RepID=W8BD12_CERCA|nr:alpha-L-iduronidase [Ceratitis capitata]CAD6998462.1 unnamed protein product [Ceratitis capitata]